MYPNQLVTKSNQIMMERTSPQPELKSIFSTLHSAFVIVPIVAGLDKFTNLLTQWDQYISPFMLDILPFSGSALMKVVGVIEIIAGFLVLRKPLLGGYIVAAWLALIALSLLFGLQYLDVAVRDLMMALAALSMARLSKFV